MTNLIFFCNALFIFFLGLVLNLREVEPGLCPLRQVAFLQKNMTKTISAVRAFIDTFDSDLFG